MTLSFYIKSDTQTRGKTENNSVQPVSAWCFGCCPARRGLPVGFLLLRYSVLFAIVSLSLLCLLFVSWFVSSRGWCIGGLGIFCAGRASVCLDPHLDWRWGWSAVGPVWALRWGVFTDLSRAVLLLWIIYVVSVLFCYDFLQVCLLVPYGRLLGGGWPLGSRLWCLIVTLSLSHWYPGSGVVLDCIDS